MRWHHAPLGALFLASGTGVTSLFIAATVTGCSDAPVPAIPIDHPANPLAAVTPLPEPSTTLAGGPAASVSSPATAPAATTATSNTAPPTAVPAHDHSSHAGHHRHEGGQ